MRNVMIRFVVAASWGAVVGKTLATSSSLNDAGKQLAVTQPATGSLGKNATLATPGVDFAALTTSTKPWSSAGE